MLIHSFIHLFIYFMRSDILLQITGEELRRPFFLVNETVLPICELPNLTGIVTCPNGHLPDWTYARMFLMVQDFAFAQI